MARRRHLAKAITYRVIASVITFCWAWLLLQTDAHIVAVAGYMTVAEIISKTALYYAHERVWHRWSPK